MNQSIENMLKALAFYNLQKNVEINMYVKQKVKKKKMKQIKNKKFTYKPEKRQQIIDDLRLF